MKNHRLFGQIVLQRRFLILKRGFHARQALPLGQKIRRRAHAEQAQLAAQCVVTPGLFAPPLDGFVLGADVRAELLQPVAAAVGHAAAQAIFLQALGGALGFQTLNLLVLALPVFGEQRDPLVQQVEFQTGEITFQRLAAGT